MGTLTAAFRATPSMCSDRSAWNKGRVAAGALGSDAGAPRARGARGRHWPHHGRHGVEEDGGIAAWRWPRPLVLHLFDEGNQANRRPSPAGGGKPLLVRPAFASNRSASWGLPLWRRRISL